MKVTKITTQPTFQPIELKITIESQEEKSVLRKLFYSEVSNPRILCENGIISEEDKETLSNIFVQFQKCL